MPPLLDISVSQFVAASAERVRAVMFDPLQDPALDGGCQHC